MATTAGGTMATSESIPAKAGPGYPENQRCAACGVPFHCGLDDSEPCWCASDFPPVVSGQSGGSCLCPRCLASLIGLKGAS